MDRNEAAIGIMLVKFAAGYRQELSESERHVYMRILTEYTPEVVKRALSSAARQWPQWMPTVPQIQSWCLAHRRSAIEGPHKRLTDGRPAAPPCPKREPSKGTPWAELARFWEHYPPGVELTPELLAEETAIRERIGLPPRSPGDETNLVSAIKGVCGG